MERLGQDIRYGLRNLHKTPGFAIVAVLTLALGIGASTAIFSVMENILMEPFPYPDAQRYFSMQIHDTERNEPGGAPGSAGPNIWTTWSRITYLTVQSPMTGWTCCTAPAKARRCCTEVT